jgi:microcystin degradation protein MlrC
MRWATRALPLGGKTDPRFGGGPLPVTGRLRLLSDGHYTGGGAMIGGLQRSWGPMAVLQVDGIQVLVTSVRAQILDLQQFRAFGIDPAAAARGGREVDAALPRRLRAHRRPVIVCDSGALATPQAHLRPYARVRRPVWPLDKEASFEKA